MTYKEVHAKRKETYLYQEIQFFVEMLLNRNGKKKNMQKSLKTWRKIIKIYEVIFFLFLPTKASVSFAAGFVLVVAELKIEQLFHFVPSGHFS